MKKILFYATIIQFMQKQNAISENQKHSIENTLKGAYQLKKITSQSLHNSWAAQQRNGNLRSRGAATGA